MSTESMFQPLAPATLPLCGRHLIEASAGTGKTYNITRLYLRLLLERQLTVQQILVMTFTNAATEELRGRIDDCLRETLSNWAQLVVDDPFYQALSDKYDYDYVAATLKPALLELDDAAVFTIHGFCQRALSSQAFASGMSMNVGLETDTSGLLLDATRDWLRKINQQAEKFALLQGSNWHIPETFVKEFSGCIRTSSELLLATSEDQIAALAEQLVDQESSLFKLRSDALAQFKILDACAEQAFTPKQADLANRIPALGEWLADESQSSVPRDFKVFKTKSNYSAAGKKDCALWLECFASYVDALSIVVNTRETWLRAARMALVKEGCNEIAERFLQAKARANVMDFDDLIQRLSNALVSEPQGQLAQALQAQYPAALVDEFQDTDPLQYAMLDVLYPRSADTQTLLMIGDPKQAIYAFRGGDIFTYLAARNAADHLWRMDTNYRSLKNVVEGYNAVFTQNGDNAFGQGIGYAKVHASPHAKANKTPIEDRHSKGGMHYVYLSEVQSPSGKKGDATTEDLMAGLSTACATEIVRLLTDVQLGADLIAPNDIAILVRRGREAEFIKQALLRHGLSSVYLSDKTNVYSSQEAAELEQVLAGVLHYEDSNLLRTASSTRLMGGNASKLLAMQQDESGLLWEAQQNFALTLRQRWLRQGVMSMILALVHEYYEPDPHAHERALTNMLHLAEQLQQASIQYIQPKQLLAWYRQQRQQAENQAGSDQAQLRLESDNRLIRIVTQHGSKGLEYPVVFIPFASQYSDPAKLGSQFLEVCQYHSPQGKPLIQLGRTDEATEALRKEGHDESLRLLYVAMTRATHRCYLGVADFKQTEISPLGLALGLKDVGHWQAALARIVEKDPSASTWESVSESFAGALVKDGDQSPQPDVSKLTRSVDSLWSLSSFSSIAKNAAELRQTEKERDSESPIQVKPKKAATLSSDLPLRFSLKKGADTGNLLHDALEHTDFTAPDWDNVLAEPLNRFGSIEERDKQALQQWLDECLAAPLTSELALCKLPLAATLREAEFYFPTCSVNIRQLYDLLAVHRGQTISPYATNSSRSLEGMMHGFIDLIFEWEGKFYVADYKSTHLGDCYEDYCFEALQANNRAHDYDLQYLIYSVALHRYLQNRIANYDPQLHFGGVYYLYLRGMKPNLPVEAAFSGVFYAEIDAALLLQLDGVFSGEAK